MKILEENALRFKRMIALLLILVLVMPMGVIHANDDPEGEGPEWSDMYKLSLYLNPLGTLSTSIDVTDHSFSEQLMVGMKYSPIFYAWGRFELAMEGGNRADKRVVNDFLQIDQGATSETITLRVVIDGDYYFTHTINVVGTDPEPQQPQEPQPRPINVTIRDGATQQPLQGVTIEVNGVASYATDVNGFSTIYLLGTEKVTLKKEGYHPVSISTSDLAGSRIETVLQRLTPELNNAALAALITEAKTLYSGAVMGNGVGQYPSDEMDAFHSAITAAEHTRDTGATQAAIDSMAQHLSQAMSAFKSAVNKANLNDLDALLLDAWNLWGEGDAGERVGQYPKAALDLFLNEILAAEDVVLNYTDEEEIQDTYIKLINAMAVFRASVNKAGDPAQLKTKIKEAWDLYLGTKAGDQPGEYPEAVHTALVDAIIMAEETVRFTTTQSKLDASLQQLEAVIAAFKAAVNPQEQPIDITREVLYAKILEAKALYDNSVVGTGDGQYPSSAKSQLRDFIEEAEFMYSFYSSYPTKINEAYVMITNAITEFLAQQINLGSYVKLEQTLAEANALLDSSNEGIFVGMYPPEAFAAFTAAIVTAQQGLTSSATDAQLDAARVALSSAITDFKNAVNKEGNPSALLAKIEAANLLYIVSQQGNSPGDYPLTAFQELGDAIMLADSLTHFPKSQAQYDQGIEDLENAMQAFRDAKITGPIKQPLQDAIMAAKAFVNAAIEGTDLGQYPVGSKSSLQNDIDTAFATLTDLSVTQAQVDQALALVNQSLASFKALVNLPGDDSNLAARIAYANGLWGSSSAGEEIGQYPAEARTALKAAITAAEAVVAEPRTQAELDTALEALAAAIAAFNKAAVKAGDNTQLVNKRNEVSPYYSSPLGNDPNQYSEAAMNELKKAMDAAYTVTLVQSSQKTIDDAYQALVTAFQAFLDSKIPEADKAALITALAEAKAFVAASVEGTAIGQYPEGTKWVVELFIETAEGTIANPHSSQALVNQSLANLNSSLANFKASVIKAGDTSKLLQKISEAQTLLQTSVEGEHVGEFPADEVAAFKAAITDAVFWSNTPGTQQEINEAYQALVTAIADFTAAEIQEGDYYGLLQAIAQATSLHETSLEGYGAGQYWPEARQTFWTAIQSAQAVAAGPSTQGEINAASLKLGEAKMNFLAAEVPIGNDDLLKATIANLKTFLGNVTEGDDAGEYPAGSKAVLQAAIAAAELVVNQPSSQFDIDQAKDKLEAAYLLFQAGVVPVGDNFDLGRKIQDALNLWGNSKEGDTIGSYPAQARAALHTAIVAASSVANVDASQAKIDQAYQVLVEAMEDFQAAIIKQGNKDAIMATFTAANSLLNDSSVGENVGQYPLAAKNTFEAAIDAAKAVLNNPATQAQLDAAQAALQTAITMFEASANQAGDKGEASIILTNATTLLNSSAVGEGVGQYPQAAKTTFEAAIATAKAVLNGSATQAQIDAAQAALQAAITTFEATVNKQGNKGEASVTLSAADTLFNSSTVGEGVGQYPQAAKTTFEAAIAAAKAVLNGSATQAQIDAAQTALEAAIAAFEATVNKQGNKGEASVTLSAADTLFNNSTVGEGVGQYPQAAKTTFEAAIAAAKAVLNGSATQAQIDAAQTALEAAIAAFEATVNKQGNKGEASVILTNATTLFNSSTVGEGVGQYPQAAKTTFEAAIAAAKAMLNGAATQAQIDAAKLALANAIDVFENSVHKEGHDKSEAQVAVNEAMTLIGKAVVGSGLGQYPAEAVQVLEDVIKATRNVIDKSSSQAEIDAAKVALTTAIAAFEASVIQPGDAEPVQTKITAATTLLKESTEGNSVGQYPTGSKATLQAAITKAEQVIANAATPAEIDQALTDLTAAIATFKAAVRTSSIETNTSAPSGGVPSTVTQPSTKITDGLNTVETGQGTVKAAAKEIQEIMQAAKPVVLESTLAIIDFGKNSLNVTELKQGLDAYLELGALLTEKSKTDEVLAGAKLDQTGMQPLGGKVLDLVAQLNYSDGTSTRIKSFAEPVKVTINLKELGLTGSTDKLTAVRFVPQADGTYKTIKLGGVYIAATNSFEFYTDSFSLYSIVKADSVNKITFTINSTDYAIGALALKTDVPPVVQKERTLVPIRVVAEALGAEVKWDHATKTATITLGDKVLTMTLNQMIAGMDVPAQGIDGRIMVPLRYVSETLGAYVMWFPQEKRIEVIQ
jgi:hypothetical protein